jgi:hypothetical protein
MKTGQPCRRRREAIHLRVCGALEGQEAARVEAHVAICVECRRYGEELQAAAAGLRWLGSRDVEPRPGFRARWTRAIQEAARPNSFEETADALATWGRGLLLRNFRPALGVASLWILTLIFRLSAPAVAPSTQSTAARSPVELFRALEDHTQLLARQIGSPSPAPIAPRSAHPRRERAPSQPRAHWDHESGADVAALKLLPPPIAHAITAAPLPV